MPKRTIPRPTTTPSSSSRPDKSGPKPQRILAFDPGYTTGIAFRLPDGQYQTAVSTTREECLELIVPGTQLVIVERFQTAGILSAPGLHTIELGSEIVGYCKALNIPWVRQQPTQRYGGMPLARGAVGHCIDQSPVAKHEVDALAHIIVYELEHDIECWAMSHWKPKGKPEGQRPPRRTGSAGRPKQVNPRERIERLKDRFRER